MKKPFGVLPSGEQASLYTISCGPMTAQISDYGATLVRLYVPDQAGVLADVVLGYEDCNGYRTGGGYLGCTVGRNANRVGGARFVMNDREFNLEANDNDNNLHSGSECYAFRIWQVEKHEASSVTFCLNSPDGDQGFPGNAQVKVRYSLEPGGVLRITYDAVSDRDTVFNMTNHSYFNMAGHDKPEKAMEQVLQLNALRFTPADALSIPTGELRSVAGTPMDFRMPKAVGRDLDQDYDALQLQGGYDHNFEVFTDPCAILSDPVSGRTMAVSTDCPGVQFYCGNFLTGEIGKDGVAYIRRGGVALETQYYPDAVNHPEWPQPFYKAGQSYHSETKYIFR